MRKQDLKQEAGALMIALAAVAVLGVFAAVALRNASKQYRHAYQVSGWEEALQAAEAGVDIGVSELRRTLYDPDNAFKTWQPAAGGNWGAGPVDLTVSSAASTNFLPGRRTEGGANSQATVQVSAPPFLQDARGEQWYKIVVTATADVPGGSVVASSEEDRRLRHIDLYRDRDNKDGNTNLLARPQAKRRIEAIAKPVGAFSQALLAVNTIDMNNHNIVVDSYDSRDERYSTNGEYDPAKRTENADIATNGTVIDAGQAHIHGNASTNGGVVLNAQNVTGTIYTDFYQESFSVKKPNVAPDPGGPTNINNTMTLNAKPTEPAYFEVNSINLSGQKSLTVAGAADGSTTYAQIVVNGDISLSGQAKIVVAKGVKLRIFVVGNADITGNGIQNTNSPLYMQMYGVDRTKPDGTPGTAGSMKIAGNGGFRGTVYAPNYDIELVGGGSTDSVFGAFIGRNIRMTGVQSIHYDEALSEGGLITDYRVISWFEDMK